MFRDQVKFSFKRKIGPFISAGLVFVFLFPACMPEKPAERVLTEKEMVAVLTEIYLMESKVGQVSISYDSIKKIFPKLEAKVFEKMGVTDSVFQKSMEFYLNNPKKLENIYAALIDSLNLKSQSIAPPTSE